MYSRELEAVTVIATASIASVAATSSIREAVAVDADTVMLEAVAVNANPAMPEVVAVRSLWEEL